MQQADQSAAAVVAAQTINPVAFNQRLEGRTLPAGCRLDSVDVGIEQQGRLSFVV